MTPAVNRRRCHRQTREELAGEIIARTLAEQEPGRTSLAIGCHLVGWFTDEPLDQVVAELVESAGDPTRLATLGWQCSCLPWPLPWSLGDIAVWCACKLQAIVSRDAAGEVTVKRFD